MFNSELISDSSTGTSRGTAISKKSIFTFMAIIVCVVLEGTAFAGQHTSKSVDDLEWVQGGPGLYFALAWGDWTKDEYGMLVKIKAGHAAPKHSHTSDYHGVTIKGNWVHTYGEIMAEHWRRVPMLFNLEKRTTAIAAKDRRIVSSLSINTGPAILLCPKDKGVGLELTGQ